MEQTSQDDDSSKARMYVPKKAFLSRMQSFPSESRSNSGNNLLSGQMSIPDDLRLSFSEIEDTSIPLDELDFTCSPSSDLADLSSTNIVSLENVKDLHEDKDLQQVSTPISSTLSDTSIFNTKRLSQNGMDFDSMDSQLQIQRQLSGDSSQNPYTNIENGKNDTQATISSSTKLTTSSNPGLDSHVDNIGHKRTWDTSQSVPWQIDMKKEAPQVSTVGSSGEVLPKKKVSPRRGSKNKHMENKLCQVCGDIAAGFYCGAFICEACKKFYMRAYKQDKMKYVCLRDKNCIITKESRVQCQFCRFQKCVNLNMHCPKQGEETTAKDMNITDIPCRVCSAPSSGFHFGAITCEGCKGFFRRMAKEREIEKYQCNKKGQCEINMITRNLCKACRYRQCIAAGMSVEGSRIGRQPNSVKHAISLELKHHVKTDLDPIPTSLDEELVHIKEEPKEDDETAPDQDMTTGELSFWDDLVTSEFQPQNDLEFSSKSQEINSPSSNNTASEKCSAYQTLRETNITPENNLSQSSYQHNQPVPTLYSQSSIGSQWSLSSSHSQVSTQVKRLSPVSSPSLHSPPIIQPSPQISLQPQIQQQKQPQSLMSESRGYQLQQQKPQQLPQQQLPQQHPQQHSSQQQQSQQQLSQQQQPQQQLPQNQMRPQQQLPQWQGQPQQQLQGQRQTLNQPQAQLQHQLPVPRQLQPNQQLQQQRQQLIQSPVPTLTAQAPSTSQPPAITSIFPTPGRDPMFLLGEGQGGGSGRLPTMCPDSNDEIEEFLNNIIEAGKVLQLLNYRVFDAEMASTTSMNVEDIKSLFKSKYMDPRMGNKITPNIDMSILATKESTWNYMMTNFHHNTYITIRFAKMVPGFKSLLLNDQVKLIQYSIYPIELLNMSKVYDVETRTYNYFTYTKEEENIMMDHFPMLKVFQDHLHHVGEMVCSFEFTDEEVALLSALLLFPAEIHGLEDPKAVDKLQNQISSALQYYEEKTFPDGLTRYGILLVRVAELVQCLLQHNLAIGLLLTYNPRIQVPQLFHELIIESIQEGKKN